MRSWIAILDAPIVTARDDGAVVVNQNRAYGYSPFSPGLLGLGYRRSHVLLIAV